MRYTSISFPSYTTLLFSIYTHPDTFVISTLNISQKITKASTGTFQENVLSILLQCVAYQLIIEVRGLNSIINKTCQFGMTEKSFGGI